MMKESSPLILLIDTRERSQLRLALIGNDEVLATVDHDGPAQDLTKLVLDILSAAQKEITDLTAIAAYTSGPSITGVRIGLTLANTFAWRYKIGLIGLPAGRFETVVKKLATESFPTTDRLFESESALF